MKYSEYLVYSTTMNRYIKLGLHDGNVKEIFSATGHTDDDLRFCSCCGIYVCLGDWPEHIKSYYHQILFKFTKRMCGCCWYGNKQILPHQVNECTPYVKREHKR